LLKVIQTVFLIVKLAVSVSCPCWCWLSCFVQIYTCRYFFCTHWQQCWQCRPFQTVSFSTSASSDYTSLYKCWIVLYCIDVDLRLYSIWCPRSFL